jgi:UDP-N-acetylmuramate dehydrogenase
MIQRDISLKSYNTFGLDYKASCFNTINSEREAISIFKNQELLDEPILILGGGSNLLFMKNFKGTIIHPEIEGLIIEEQKKESVIISSGAGIIWDDLVEWTVQLGYGGLENLSFIPGSVGASPVQNIGAYGVEVRETIEKVRTVSISDGTIKEFSNEECRFSYRNSIFKDELKGKYLVTKVFFRLTPRPIFKTDYGSLKEEVRKLGPLSLNTLRRAVINIRRKKLPDPQTTGNAGSFFKNPVVESSVADNLLSIYPDIPYYNDIPGYKKISAGWLIDQCGWKGKRIGNAGVHEKQALVLVNYGNASGEELLELSVKIARSVSDKFGIELQREVEVI